MKIASCFIKEARAVIKEWNYYYNMDNTKSREILKSNYRPEKETLVEMGYALIENGIVPKK